MPVSQSVDMSALTPSAGLYDRNDLIQLFDDGANMSGDMVQSLYEYKANAIHPCDDMSIAQLLMGKNTTPFCRPSSLDQEQVQGEAGR